MVDESNLHNIATAIMKGAGFTHPVLLSLNRDSGGQLGQSGDWNTLDAKERILRIFKLLHPSSVHPKKRTMNDAEFRELRRAIGNYKYEKAMKILFAFWQASGPDEKMVVEESAQILGSLKKASGPYKWFESSIQKQV